MAIVTEHKTVIEIKNKKGEVVEAITYTTRTYGAIEALTLGARLARLVDAQSWTGLLEVEEDEVEEALENPMLVLDGLLSAAKAVSPDELASLARDLCKYTKADRVRVGTEEVPGSVFDHFDTHFAGRLGHLFEVLTWVARLGFTGPSPAAS